MKAGTDELFDMLDRAFSLTRLSYVNQSIPRKCNNGESLTVMEIYCLHVIGETDNMTVTELAKRNRRTLSSSSQIVAKLQQKGLIKRYISEEDKKIFYLRLTEKGQELFDIHTMENVDCYNDIISRIGDFSSEDVRQVIKLIDVLEEKTLHSIESKTRDIKNDRQRKKLPSASIF